MVCTKVCMHKSFSYLFGVETILGGFCGCTQALDTLWTWWNGKKSVGKLTRFILCFVSVFCERKYQFLPFFCQVVMWNVHMLKKWCTLWMKRAISIKLRELTITHQNCWWICWWKKKSLWHVFGEFSHCFFNDMNIVILLSINLIWWLKYYSLPIYCIAKSYVWRCFILFVCKTSLAVVLISLM